MTNDEVNAIFCLSGIEILKKWELMNQYWPRNYTDAIMKNPWWLVKTEFGLITIGWRKRVISIDWSDTGIKCEIGPDDVTKTETMIHAWSELKAVEYLQKLKVQGQSQKPKEVRHD